MIIKYNQCIFNRCHLKSRVGGFVFFLIHLDTICGCPIWPGKLRRNLANIGISYPTSVFLRPRPCSTWKQVLHSTVLVSSGQLCDMPKNIADCPGQWSDNALNKQKTDLTATHVNQISTKIPLPCQSVSQSPMSIRILHNSKLQLLIAAQK